jgi:serine/threonine protein phosphatase PrpC
MGCLNSKRALDDNEGDFKSSRERSGRTPRRAQTPASHDTDAWGAPVPMRPKAKSGPVTSTGGPVTPKLKPVTASGPLPRSAAGAAKIHGNINQGASPNFIIDMTPGIKIPLPTQPKPVFQLQPKAKAHSRTSKSGVLYQHTPFSKIPPEGGIPEVIVDMGNNSPHSDQYLPPCGSRVVKVPAGNYELHYSVLSQRGHYPDALRKANQDTFAIHTSFGGDPNEHFFGVFDGHGEYGQHCSHFARKNLCKNLQNDSHYPADVVQAYHSAFLATNSQLHSNNEVDDSMSGTTGISILVRGRKLYVANVGDSRAVLAVRRKGEKKLQAKDLSFDQTPYRADECARVRSCSARVMTLDQLEGLKDPNVQCWDAEGHDDGDPPRLWVPHGMYPGTAFTRSIGDTVAEEIGVTAVPEVLVMELRPRHPFFVIASDGVFEFLSSQDVVDMVRFSELN